MKPIGLTLLLSSTVLLGSCAAKKPLVFTGFFKDLNGCAEEFAEMDARVAAAGVGDAAYYRVPGFPYFRTDRTLASFANEIDSFEQVGGWIRQMRDFDQEAREFEYTNLGMSIQQAAIKRSRLQICSRGLSDFELEDPAALARLKKAVQPTDEYSGVARTIGLYPLAVPLLRARINAEQEAVRKDFAAPLAALDAPGELVLWTVKPEADPELAARGFQDAFADELGMPGLVESQWRALAEKYAPQLWIETAGPRDLPGTPVWIADGKNIRPGVDSSQPLVNFTISFARFGGLPVAQITYFVWFGGNSADAPIDGAMWRVTLDIHAQPVVFESLHASGRAHSWFPVQPLARRVNDSYWHQPELFPQDSTPMEQTTLRLKSGTHALRRVVAGKDASAVTARTFELRRYEDLYLLPLPAGGTRSLFGPDGIVAGSGGADPLWLWSSGLRRPGALRQYTHLPTAYIGREHFDAPFLLESVFVPPRAPPADSSKVILLDTAPALVSAAP